MTHTTYFHKRRGAKVDPMEGSPDSALVSATKFASAEVRFAGMANGRCS